MVSHEFLEHIYGVGDKIKSDLQYRYTTHRTLIQSLDRHKLQGQYGSSAVSSHNSTQKTIALTGSFPLSRSKLQYFIENA